MSESLQKTMQFLLTEGYVIHSPQQHYMFTNKFYLEHTQQDIGVVVELTEVKSKTTVVQLVTVAQSKDAYMQFILDANVPKRCEGSNNEVYATNQYSDKGAKAFREILKSGVDLDLLIKATQLYYKSPGYKLKVGNYIGEGTWRTHYQEMVDSIDKKQLKEHIKGELTHDTTGTSKYNFRTVSGGQGQEPRIEGSSREKPWNTNHPKALK